MTVTTIPDVPLYTGGVPLIGQGEPTFSANAQTSLVYQANLPVDLNATISAMNQQASEVEVLSQTALAAASYKGDWSAATGAYSQGDTFSHIGFIWMLKVGASDITAIEPSFADTTNWLALQRIGTEPLGGFTEAFVDEDASDGFVDINASLYNVVKTTILGLTVGVAFSNVPAAGVSYTCTIQASAVGAGKIDWGVFSPGTIKWQGGSAPADLADGQTDIYVLQTLDGGSTWLGSYCQEYA